jgi:hypothetical protein
MEHDPLLQSCLLLFPSLNLIHWINPKVDKTQNILYDKTPKNIIVPATNWQDFTTSPQQASDHLPF